MFVVTLFLFFVDRGIAFQGLDGRRVVLESVREKIGSSDPLVCRTTISWFCMNDAVLELCRMRSYATILPAILDALAKETSPSTSMAIAIRSALCCPGKGES